MTLFDVSVMHLFIDRYSIQGSPVVRIISPHAVDMAECLISRRLGPGREQPQNPLGAYRPEWQRVLGDDRGKSLDCRHYSERAIVEQRIKDSCEEMADKIEEHVAVLDSNLAAQRRYHRLFKHLRQLASDEDDARE
ncbi:hypothetical protein VE01_02773 [Pseudogymnoascus verrucosus]|uniref:Uncharacterized protein n=1 Tax=Pseudogymnoascus verrucosus TaxID=342668 RepID=A0A1B8GUN2_9PEZI|nr:uncharacterized protein VE01_02773 [Pseudogymnoascus verrucosus]OBT99552.1 hypothetical protein VE01_02773 [Pseudogymnoascus verrucosus]